MMENIAVVLLALELRVVFPFGKNSRVATTKKKKTNIRSAIEYAMLQPLLFPVRRIAVSISIKS